MLRRLRILSDIALPTGGTMKTARIIAVLATASVLAITPLVLRTVPAHADVTLLSQGKPATASSTENGGTPAAAAVDGNNGTRWSSAFSDPQWLRVDLGAKATISQVVLRWETAYGRAFEVQVSDDGSAWTPIFSTTTGTGGVQTLTVSRAGRYVRMYGTVRGTVWGYSLWEFQVFGSFDGSVPVTDPRNPDFGPSVSVFGPSTPAADIQAKLNSIFTSQ